MREAVRGAAAAAVALLGVVLGVVVLFGGEEEQATAACSGGGGGGASVSGVPAGPVAGYGPEQLANAAVIMRAGADAGLDVHGQTLGVAAAMGESALVNIDHGDKVGPDSTGLFQQRDPWGPRPARMDPYTSATMFFTGGQGGQDGLADIPGWEDLAPTVAIHRVQHNADANHYAKFWGPATQVVAALSGVDVTVLASSDGSTPVSCGGGAGAVPAGAGGWTDPVPDGTLTSGFDPARVNPVTGKVEPHNGDDLAAPLGTPIYAAAGAVDAAGNPVGGAATVISSGPASGFGNWIRLDHGNGYVTVYGHMRAADLLVAVGDTVVAGQQIARVGAEGQATGPHCHFEVRINGVPTDPAPFMAAHGAPLR